MLSFKGKFWLGEYLGSFGECYRKKEQQYINDSVCTLLPTFLEQNTAKINKKIFILIFLAFSYFATDITINILFQNLIHQFSMNVKDIGVYNEMVGTIEKVRSILFWIYTTGYAIISILISFMIKWDLDIRKLSIRKSCKVYDLTSCNHEKLNVKKHNN